MLISCIVLLCSVLWTCAFFSYMNMWVSLSRFHFPKQQDCISQEEIIYAKQFVDKYVLAMKQLRLYGVYGPLREIVSRHFSVRLTINNHLHTVLYVSHRTNDLSSMPNFLYMIIFCISKHGTFFSYLIYTSTDIIRWQWTGGNHVY